MLQGRPIHVIQGEFKVSNDPDVVFATLLGSCVSACIRDPVLGAGGINHFLLPGDSEHSTSAYAERYGVHLMELLINGLMQMGARRNRLEAKLFGGARMVNNLSDIGMQNAAFAERFLKHEGIPIVSQDLGGTLGRRLQFWPVSGRARQSYISPAQVMEREKAASIKPAPLANEIDLF